MCQATIEDAATCLIKALLHNHASMQTTNLQIAEALILSGWTLPCDGVRGTELRWL